MPLLTTKVTGQKEKKRRHLPFVICEGNVTWILMFQERYFPVAQSFHCNDRLSVSKCFQTSQRNLFSLPATTNSRYQEH